MKRNHIFIYLNIIHPAHRGCLYLFGVRGDGSSHVEVGDLWVGLHRWGGEGGSGEGGCGAAVRLRLRLRWAAILMQ